VILFIVSYGILTLLVFKQAETIESQRGLIREMLKDSTQLAALKGKPDGGDSQKMQSKAAAQAGGKDAKSGNPAAATRKSDKGTDNKETRRPGKSTRSTKQVPGKPAADLEDVRRTTQVI
jgi:hypothetical protein